MSHSVTTLISFVIRDRDRLRGLAREHAQRLHAIDNSIVRDSDLEAFKRMLDDVAEGHCVGLGRNGDVFSYGFVGNYTSISRIQEHLGEFLGSIFSSGVVRRNDALMVLLQNEQHLAIEAFEIRAPWESSRITVNDLQVRGRTHSFPVWSSERVPVLWFQSSPLQGDWEGEH